MRLHLNKTLRAALIAAITAVGFTLPQTYAATTEATILSLPDSITQITSKPNGWQQNIGAQGSINGTIVATDLSVCTALASDGWHWGVANLQNACAGDCTTDVATGTITFKGRQGYGGEFVAGTVDVETLLSDASASEVTQLTFNFAKGSPSQGDLTFSAWYWDGVSATATALVSANSSLPTTATNYVWAADDSGLTSGKILIVFSESSGGQTNTINNFSAKATLSTSTGPVGPLTWAGSEGNNVLTSAVWDDGESKTADYSTVSALIFGADGYKTVAINTAAIAKSVEVQGLGYVFETAAESSLTTKVKVDAGASLNLAGVGSYNISTAEIEAGATLTATATANISTLTGAGDLTAGAGSNVSVNALSSYTGTMGVTAGGTLNLGSDIILENLTVENGTVTTKHAGGNGVITDTLTIGADGTFKVMGDHDAFGYNNGKTKKIVIGGTNGHMATLALEQISGNSVTMSTDITMNGYAQITDASKNSKGFNTYNGNITVSGVENSIAIIDLRNAVTIDVAAEGTLSVGKFTQNGTNKPAVTKTGAGTMSITDASLLPGTLNINAGTVSIGADTTIAGLNIAADGSLTVASGTTTVSGNSNVVSHTIGIGATGILNLTGTYDVSGIASDGGIDYVGGEGIAPGNGFKKVTGMVHVLDIAEGGQFSQEGATINYGDTTYTLDASGAIDLSGAPDYTTFYVNDGTESYTAAQTVAERESAVVSAVVLANNTTITMDKEAASIALTLTGAAGTVNATEATTITGISGWTKELAIGGTAEVTIAGQTLTGTQKLVVNGIVSTTGALTVNNADAALTVAKDATLGVTGNLTPIQGTVNILGTVNISGELDLSKGQSSNVQMQIGSTGKVTSNGMWMFKNAALELAEGGTYTTNKVLFTGKAGSGSITVGSGNEIHYGSDNGNALISNLTMEALGNITIANQLTNVDVVTGAHAVTLNTNADSVTVSDGGTFTLKEGKTVTNITVENGGTIAGGVETSKVGIKVGATATFNEGITDELASVTFGWDTPVQVTNNGEQTAAYSGIDDTNMRVAADVLSAEAESAVTVENQVAVEEIVNYGTGALTLTQVDKDVLDSVYSYGGPLSLQGITEVTLANLSIGAGSTVAVYTDATAEAEGTVTINDTLTAGGGTLKANLTLVGDSTLDLSLMDGGMEALTLGSTLTIDTETGLVNLDIDTLRALDALKLGESLTLITALDETTLAYGQDGGYTGTWYGQMFNREGASEFEQYSLKGDFQVFSTEQGFGLTKVSNVPEPTTGTLSLLALMALAARRRKH